MNPMSALYQIAQNDPPTLKITNDVHYTDDFISFIAMCLQKLPNERPAAKELLSVMINFLHQIQRKNVVCLWISFSDHFCNQSK